MQTYVIMRRGAWDSEEELDAVEAEVEADVQDSIRFAESSPEPAPEALFENIYVES